MMLAFPFTPASAGASLRRSPPSRSRYTPACRVGKGASTCRATCTGSRAPLPCCRTLRSDRVGKVARGQRARSSAEAGDPTTPPALCRSRAPHPPEPRRRATPRGRRDRKSTRLNSSHSSISYAVFCLKKKKKKKKRTRKKKKKKKKIK